MKVITSTTASLLFFMRMLLLNSIGLSSYWPKKAAGVYPPAKSFQLLTCEKQLLEALEGMSEQLHRNLLFDPENGSIIGPNPLLRYVRRIDKLEI
jgi:hypothetical protein